MRIKTLPLFAAALLSASALASCGPARDKDEPFPLSGETIKHNLVLSSNLIQTRFPCNLAENDMGNEEMGYGLNWKGAEDWDFEPDVDNNLASFARVVIDAPFTGEYPAILSARHYGDQYRFRVYTNSKAADAYQDITITTAGGWADTETDTSEFNLDLNKGKNVILIQVIDWGAASSLTLPEELNVISSVGKNNDNGEYTTKNFIYNNTRHEVAQEGQTNALFNVEKELEYKALEADSNPNYENAAILHFTPKSTTKSLDVTYKIVEKTNGGAGIVARLGLDARNNYALDVSDKSLNEEHTAHIPSNELEDLGFTTGTKQNLRLACNSGKIKILKVKESTVQDQPSQFKTLGVNDIKAGALIRGRNIASDEHIGLDYTGSGIEFNIVGGGSIVMNMTHIADTFGNNNTSAGGTRFAVEIDGQFTKYVVPSSNMDIASDLSATSHHVALYKTSEAAGGIVNLNSMKIGNDATISKPTKDYRFEILGDSITCGNQITATDENGYLAYTSQLSKSWNANFNAISCSGRGLYIGYNSEEGWAASYNNQIKDIWNDSSFFRDGGASDWDKTSYTPDVVIINIGNNDLGDWPVSIMGSVTPFMNTVVSFSQSVRTAYPNAKIIWCYGAFVNRSYESEYRNAVQSLNDANMDFVYFNQMGGGADGHPNAEQHQTIADILSAKIASMLNVSDPRA